MKLSEQEKKIHDRAVSVRRMTDRQLCDHLDAEYRRGVEDGRPADGIVDAPAPTPSDNVCSFIAYLEERIGTKNGIGRGTVLQLRRELSNAVAAGIFKHERE